MLTREKIWGIKREREKNRKVGEIQEKVHSKMMTVTTETWYAYKET